MKNWAWGMAGSVYMGYKGFMRSRFVRGMRKPRHPYRVFRLWRWKRKVNRSLKVLDELDYYLRSIGWNRTQIRQFWGEFRKKQAHRTKVLNKLTQD